MIIFLLVSSMEYTVEIFITVQVNVYEFAKTENGINKDKKNK